MIIRTIKAEVKYLYYEFCSLWKSIAIFILLFIGAYFFSITNSYKANVYTNADYYLLIHILTIYMLLRMILTGFSLPINVFEHEKLRCGNLLNNTISNHGIVTTYTIRILLKAINSAIVNCVSLFIILHSWNFAVYIRNYVLIFLLMIIGTLYMLAFGFAVNVIMQFYGFKRELVFIFEVIMFISYNVFNSDNYFFPITILMTQVEGVFTNDIFYCFFVTKEVMGYLPLWIMMTIISMFVIISSLYITIIIQTVYRYKKRII